MFLPNFDVRVPLPSPTLPNRATQTYAATATATMGIISLSHTHTVILRGIMAYNDGHAMRQHSTTKIPLL